MASGRRENKFCMRAARACAKIFCHFSHISTCRVSATRKSLAQELWGSREPRFDHEAVSLPAPRRFSAPPPGPESCTSARAHRAIVCRRHCSLALASSFLLRTLFPGLYGPECGNTSQLACTQHPSTPTITPAYTRSTIGDDQAPELAPGTAGKSTVADLGHFGFES